MDFELFGNLFFAGMAIVALIAIMVAIGANAETRKHQQEKCIPCPDCKEWISKEAESCPKCGKPMKGKPST